MYVSMSLRISPSGTGRQRGIPERISPGPLKDSVPSSKTPKQRKKIPNPELSPAGSLCRFTGSKTGIPFSCQKSRRRRRLQQQLPLPTPLHLHRAPCLRRARSPAAFLPPLPRRLQQPRRRPRDPSFLRIRSTRNVLVALESDKRSRPQTETCTGLSSGRDMCESNDSDVCLTFA